MTPDRIDDLLSRALQTGVIPGDATEEERAEVEQLLERAEDVRLNAAVVRAEADGSMPAARARFQRHLAARRPAAASRPVVGAAKAGFFGRIFAGRGLALASSLGTIAIVAVLAIVILEPFNGAETAAALTIDNYVQVQGVVAEAGEDGVVTVRSPDFGNLEVALSEVTSLVNAEGARPAEGLQTGDTVLVGGIVTARRAIAASSVAVAENQAEPRGGDRPKIRVLENFRPLQGTIKLFSLGPNGLGARVLIATPDEGFFVDVDRASVDQFLATAGTALEARVRVVEGRGLPNGVFRLERLEGPEGAGRPRFQNVRGVILGRMGNVFQVETDRGTVAVMMRPATQIRPGESGLTFADIREGEAAIGYPVVIAGNLNANNPRQIVAEMVFVQPKPGQ